MPIRLAFLCVLQLLLSTTAFAQNIDNLLNTLRGFAPQGFIQQGMIQAARFEWSKLPPNEIACIDQTLRERGGSIADLINHGVPPYDQGLSQLRSICSVQVEQQSPSPMVSSSTPSFDCASPKTPVAQILCTGKDGALADWNLNATAWAYAASLDDVANPILIAAAEQAGRLKPDVFVSSVRQFGSLLMLWTAPPLGT